MKKTNNKGFSLVELIVVIAIMAVLTVVVAPQFLGYVEDARRAKDIQMAASLHTAYLTDIADQTITTSVTTATNVSSQLPSTLSTAPAVEGRLAAVTDFYFTCDVATGTCVIYGGTSGAETTYNLLDETDATAYKNATNP